MLILWTGIISKNYSKGFVTQRQVALKILKSFGFGKRSSENRIQEEASFLVKEFLECNEQINPKELINISVANVICSMVFGSRYDYNDKEFETLIDCSNYMFSFKFYKAISTYLPFLEKYDNLVKSYINCQKVILNFIEKEISKNERYLENGKEQDNFIYSYLNIMKNKGDDDEDDDDSFSIEQLAFMIFDFFLGGSETTTTTIAWALIFLANRPELQRRLQEEIDRVIGDSVVSLNNKMETPLLEAFIQETLRFSTPVPMTLPHKMLKDMTLNGYHLPNGCYVRKIFR